MKHINRTFSFIMSLSHQNDPWLFLTITATFLILFVLFAYLMRRSADKEQEDIPENRLSHRVNQAYTAIHSLSTTIKRLNALSEHIHIAAGNQHGALKKALNTLSHLAANAKALANHDARLNQSINTLSTALATVNHKTNNAEQAVNEMKAMLGETSKSHRHQQQNTRDNTAIVTFLQAKIAVLSPQMAQLSTRLSRLNHDADTVSKTINTLSNRIKEKALTF